MVCEHCNSEMREIILVDDNPNRAYAHNLYQCTKCMTLCKENLWRDKGLLWIYANNDTRLYEE